MIPRRIRLHNFLSYRDCEVNLDGIRLAVLCGPNGHGKSALLDAITWALWGEGRGRLEDDRIHLGEQEMLVDFEFESSGDVFKVIRKRTRGRGAGSLEFFQLTEERGRTPLTGGTISETQAEIIRKVRLDFDTFINSAFIAQGRANEFTRKRPAERKEVFRRVLDLGRYQSLADAATERRKEAAAELRDLERNATEDAEQVRQLPAIEEEINALTCERQGLAPELQRLEEAVVELKQAAANRQRLEHEAIEALERVESLRKDVATIEGTIDQLESQLAAARAVLNRRDEVYAAYQRVEELREQEHELSERQREARDLEAAVADAERLIGIEQARLESELGSRRKELEAVEATAASLAALLDEEATAAKERETVEKLVKHAEDFEKQANDLRAKAAGFGAEANEAATQNTKLKEREAQLETVDASCPVCLRPLAPGDLDHVRQEYARQREELRARYDAARAAKVEALDRADHLTGQATGLRDDASRKDAALRTRERDLHSRITAARQAEASVEPLRETVSALESTLGAGTFASEAREKRETAAAALAALGYDATTHNAIRQQLRDSAAIENAYRELLVAEERATTAESRITTEQEQLAARTSELARAEERLVEVRDALALAEDVTPRLQEAQDALDSVRERESDLVLRLGRAQARREALVELKTRLESIQESMNARKEEEGVYGDLSKAFGRDGVQAMLIDQSLPRVEHTANDMLDRMTGGRIHVSLATQRTLASGKVTETLDIRISDEIGTRDYEMYSGGEAFRVDLALRIALARLLAERAGATLPTLIIDEGFGTQDAEGIDRLVQSITAIQDEFRLILVVTHIDELKERFERRIEVTKDRDRGSLARVF